MLRKGMNVVGVNGLDTRSLRELEQVGLALELNGNAGENEVVVLS
jgi:hypothetical protein